MEWMELIIDTTTEGTDLTANILYEAGAAGVVIEDPQDIRALLQQKGSWDYIDPGIFNAEGDRVLVKGYLPLEDDLDERLAAVRGKLKAMKNKHNAFGFLELTAGQVGDEEWAQNWKKYYKPVKIGQNIVIKPSWEDYTPREEDIVVVLDPGMAFGTGTHESTVLCIELLERYLSKGDRVVDIGCGSGILAVTAAKLGAKSVEAYDIDIVAVKVAGENVSLNKMDEVIRVERGNLLDGVRGRAHLIVSNIAADVIIRMCGTIGAHLEHEGIFIASGIIGDRLEEVKKAFEDNGLEIVERLRRNDWRALVARVKG